MIRPKLSIQSLLVLTLVVALAFGWWHDRTAIQEELSNAVSKVFTTKQDIGILRANGAVMRSRLACIAALDLESPDQRAAIDVIRTWRYTPEYGKSSEGDILYEVYVFRYIQPERNLWFAVLIVDERDAYPHFQDEQVSFPKLEQQLDGVVGVELRRPTTLGTTKRYSFLRPTKLGFVIIE